jgi:hypothetical protein
VSGSDDEAIADERARPRLFLLADTAGGFGIAILAPMFAPDTCPDVSEHLEQSLTRALLPQY